jgi:hypothetical protein
VGKLESFDLLRENSKSDVCREQQQTTFQKGTHGTPPLVWGPPLLWGLCLKLNNIEIRMESRAFKKMMIACAFNLILHLQTPDEFEESVRVEFLFTECVY